MPHITTRASLLLLLPCRVRKAWQAHMRSCSQLTTAPAPFAMQGEEGMACAWAQLVENACSREGGQHIVAVMDDRAAVQMLGQAMDLEPHRSPQVFRRAGKVVNLEPHRLPRVPREVEDSVSKSVLQGHMDQRLSADSSLVDYSLLRHGQISI
eukprot:1155610-Pelagomonas_calceolata.AAC.2